MTEMIPQKTVRTGRWFQGMLLNCRKPSCWVSFLWWWMGRRSCRRGSLPPGAETHENNCKTKIQKFNFTVVPLPSNRSSAPSSTADWRHQNDLRKRERHQPESGFQSCLLMQVKWLEECLCWPHDQVRPMTKTLSFSGIFFPSWDAYCPSLH